MVTGMSYVEKTKSLMTKETNMKEGLRGKLCISTDYRTGRFLSGLNKPEKVTVFFAFVFLFVLILSYASASLIFTASIR